MAKLADPAPPTDHEAPSPPHHTAEPIIMIEKSCKRITYRINHQGIGKIAAIDGAVEEVLSILIF
jgi:hypothetical protein